MSAFTTNRSDEVLAPMSCQCRCRASDERADLALEVSDAAPDGASVWLSPIEADSESKRTPNKILPPRQQRRPIFGRDGRRALCENSFFSRPENFPGEGRVRGPKPPRPRAHTG